MHARTKVEVAGGALADDFVEVAVLRQRLAVVPPELGRRGHQEAARAARALRREHPVTAACSVTDAQHMDFMQSAVQGWPDKVDDKDFRAT